MKVLRVLLAIGQSLLAFIGICFIGLVFYSQLPSPYSWIVSISIGVLAIYLSIKVYKIIVRRGYISTISATRSSYELDNLEPTPGSGVTELKPDELENFFDYGKLSFEAGTVSIWGDWNGKQLNKKHKLSTIEFDVDKNILYIYFTDFCRLVVKTPSKIHCANSYIKIFNAKEIKWQVPNGEGQNDQFYYLNTGKNIVTKSNTNWKPNDEDLGIGMDAIYIQG